MIDDSSRNRLIEIAESTQVRDFTKIHHLINRRGISKLFHFTHCSNLKSIFEFGIQNRKYLNSNSLTYIPTDKDRYDGFLEGISVSISRPNNFLLSVKNREFDNGLVLLEIAANTLLTEPFAAFPTNAAGSVFESLIKNQPDRFTGVRGISGMFLNDDKRAEVDVKINEPTDAQAEILFFGSIFPSTIRAVHVPKLLPEKDREFLINLENNYPGIKFDSFCNCGYFVKWSERSRKWDLTWEPDGI